MPGWSLEHVGGLDMDGPGQSVPLQPYPSRPGLGGGFSPDVPWCLPISKNAGGDVAWELEYTLKIELGAC